MRRVNVIGSSGSGKTKVGRALAARLGVPFVELDELHWRLPNWELPRLEDFRALVDEATRGDAWVVDGSYGKTRDIVWSRADTVVWLDLPFPLMFARILRRTIGRMVSGEPLWSTQRETFRAAFLSRDSLLVFAIRTQRRRARTYLAQLAEPRHAHLRVIRLRSRAEVERWLGTVEPARPYIEKQ